jgi:carboxyl-terminal processing protease
LNNKSYKKGRLFIISLAFCVVLVAVVTHHCYAALEDNITKIFSINSTSEKSAAVIDSVCDMIQKGQFQEAHKVIEDSSDLNAPGMEQLRRLLGQYDRIMQNQTGSSKEGYVKQLDELAELRIGPRVKDPNSPTEIAKENVLPYEEPITPSDLLLNSADLDGDGDVDIDDMSVFAMNWLEDQQYDFDVSDEKEKDTTVVLEKQKDDGKKESKEDEQDTKLAKKELTDKQQAAYISDIFSTVLKALEYAEPEEKKKLLEDEFIKETIQKAIDLAQKFESEGGWVDSYAHCYYWLAELDEDNAEYKEHAENLLDMAMIEMSLMDNSCETSLQRHEGIKENMLIRAVKALDFNYVNVVDYAQMANDGIENAYLLGQVVVDSKKEIAYRADSESAEKWFSGLDNIKDEVNLPDAVITMRKFFLVFDQIMDLNRNTLALPDEVVIAKFSSASLQSLDPYTSLVWPWEVKDFQKNMTNQFSGIGIRISKVRGVLTAVSLIPNTPAYRSGLDADDAILAINGESTEDMTMNCAVSKITGPRGTNVTLTIQHAGDEETEDIVITRNNIVVPTIQGWQRSDAGKWRHVIDPLNKIGYARITAFSESTAPDMEAVLNELESEGLDGFILDLRFNTGGYLSAAAEIVDLFVDDGLIVKSQPRWGVSSYEEAHKKGTHPDYPLVVLINNESASASEIVAGALQDTKFERATIVGQRSYGKGSVQTITSFSGEGSQLKYTMAYYHLPSDQRVKNRYIMEKLGRKDWGIDPDVEIKVELRTKEGQNMLKIQGANEILAKADHDKELNPVKRYSLQETIDSDPQMAVGLLVLKSKLIQSGKNIQLDEEDQAPIVKADEKDNS